MRLARTATFGMGALGVAALAARVAVLAALGGWYGLWESE
jgi:hypothetical protein